MFFLSALLCAAVVQGDAASGEIPSFYTPSVAEVAGRPGTIIRKEPLTSDVPAGAAAYRILYRSTGLHGETVPVSAVVAFPAGDAPAEGRPIVAWQHPTSGVTQACAPSLSSSVLRMIPGLAEMLRRGFVVVATDYPGLGTPERHPYLVGPSEGRSVLDAVRAARNLPEAHAGKRFALWGHSQGGHASLFAGSMAKRYVPELKLVGVAVAAPASNLTALSKSESPDTPMMSAMLMWIWSDIYHTPLERVVAPSDIPAVNLLAQQCFDPPFDSQEQPVAAPLPNATYRLTKELAATEPWKTLYVRNTPGVMPVEIPVFLAQGGADTTIPPLLTASYKQKLCGAGDTVHMVLVPGVEHRFIARDAGADAVAWIGDRFDGKPAPNDCRSGMPGASR